MGYHTKVLGEHAERQQCGNRLLGVAVLSVNPEWVGYLGFCAQIGLGQMDLSKIEIRGPKPADVTKKYRMHDDIERELRWMGPLKEIPEKLG